MHKDHQQIFQTSSPSRWQRLKWGSRVLLFIMVIALVAIVMAIRTTFMPDIAVAQSQVFKKILESPATADPITRQYQGFRKYIDNKWAKGKGCGQNEDSIKLSASGVFNDSLGIRAAFYVEWDVQDPA